MTREEFDEELEAIEAIYPNAILPTGSFYWLEIPDRPISIQLSFPSSYPTEPPNVLSVKYGPEKTLIEDLLASVFVPDQVCLFDLIETIRDTFEQDDDDSEENVEENENYDTSDISKLPKEELSREIFSHWLAGSTITDRKSVFIGFATEVNSMDDVEQMLGLLKQDNHIARATHNIVAYKIKNENGTVISDYDDDGETAAGGRVLHLMDLTDVWNVCVCVSRWYGGIKLGPDRYVLSILLLFLFIKLTKIRFKHINSAARDVLIQGGFLADNSTKKKSKK